MKMIYRMFRKTVLAATLAIGVLTSSCTDYLTILPADSVVEENFWQTKDQVYGMLATSYLKLLSNDAVTKAIVWGEMRADNMTIKPNTGGDIKDLVEFNLIDENSYCNWGVFYEAISNANLVLESADQVVERDPDFSEADLSVVKGEMYAMRALCHFYLVRSFRDIPLAMHSAKNDSEIPDYVQVHPLVALDAIMDDLNRAENMVRKSNVADAQNLGRISRNAVLAIKADVNLWRAAFATYYEGVSEYAKAGDAERYYEECLQDCRKLMANMDAALEELDDKTLGRPVERLAYNLIPNTGKADELTDGHKSTAYDEIFGDKKNSLESIFELQVQGNNITNGAFRGTYNMYGTNGNPGVAVVAKKFIDDTDNYQSDDLRLYSNTNYTGADLASGKSYCITKYASKQSPAGTSWRESDKWDANWIVYRRTDVMLMQAEALVAREGATQADFDEAYSIVRAINVRSKIDSTKMINEVQPSEFSVSSREAAWERIRKERLLELAFEGKRWYDLVRKALIAKTPDCIHFVADKLEGSTAGVAKIKMSSIDALFLPIYIDELRYNKNLKQNPAFDNKNSTSEMN
ncbi:MAG: RagB/SusD family nutrient uptake outer membrane protein [Bacteroidaceae bacterium]|nr:RagB/SusD family nutrient uptake outer membrane protein [Bacteroidaceae bacterium]